MDKVPVYSLSSGQLTEIPADELASTMIRVNVEGVGVVWVSLEELNAVRQPSGELDDSFRPYLLKIKAGLDEVYPQTVEEWEEGFRRDSNPEQEIAIWLSLAEKYQKFAATRVLSPAEKKDAFRVFLSCVNNGPQHALKTVALQAWTKQAAQQALDFFTGRDSA